MVHFDPVQALASTSSVVPSLTVASAEGSQRRRSTRTHRGNAGSQAAAAAAAQDLAAMDEYLDHGEGSVAALRKRKDSDVDERGPGRPKQKRSRGNIKDDVPP